MGGGPVRQEHIPSTLECLQDSTGSLRGQNISRHGVASVCIC